MRDAYRQMQALLAVLEDPLAYEDEPAQLPRYDRDERDERLDIADQPLPTLAEAGRRIAAGEVSPVELTEAALAARQRCNPTLDAFIEITADRARAAAKRAEREIAGGRRRGPLHGIPVWAQGHLRRGRAAHDGAFAAAARQCRRGRRRDHGAARSRRHGPDRQARDTRIRHRRPGLGPAVSAGAQPVEHRAFHRRVEQRLGRGGGGRDRRAGDGVGHRRVDPAAGGVLRHGRAQADLWPGQPARRRAAVLQPRHDRAADLDGRGRGAGVAGARRLRPARPRLGRCAGARLPRRAAPRRRRVCASATRAPSTRTAMSAPSSPRRSTARPRC